jgi:hypothetical protein
MGFGPGLRGWRHPVSIPCAHPISLFPQDTYADTKHRSWLGRHSSTSHGHGRCMHAKVGWTGGILGEWDLVPGLGVGATL